MGFILIRDIDINIDRYIDRDIRHTFHTFSTIFTYLARPQ